MREDRLDQLCPLDEVDALKLALYDDPPLETKKRVKQRIALIRASWPKHERARRRVGNGGRVEWGVPCYNCHSQRARRVCEESEDNWSVPRDTKIYSRAGSVITPKEEMRARVDNRN